jgi:hypothetical protein
MSHHDASACHVGTVDYKSARQTTTVGDTTAQLSILQRTIHHKMQQDKKEEKKH